MAWSAEVKQALLEHIPQVTLVDLCGSSEGATIGTTQVRRGMTPSTDRFTPAPGLRIIRPDGTDVLPGDEELGMFLVPTVARGYRNDPERTDAAFRLVDGQMHVLTGDWGHWNDDGTITLVGRGTSTINTGGEKVFPEEVEKVIRELPDVDDCVVLGRPDERFGTTVAAVVQLAVGTPETPDAARADHLRRPRPAGRLQGSPDHRLRRRPPCRQRQDALRRGAPGARGQPGGPGYGIPGRSLTNSPSASATSRSPSYRRPVAHRFRPSTRSMLASTRNSTPTGVIAR